MTVRRGKANTIAVTFRADQTTAAVGKNLCCVDRAVRQALVGLWTPPAIEEFQRPPRWDRATPARERVSKRAW